jgi:hypothetical protein
MMAVVQIGQQRADAWPERRTRSHPGRRFGAIPLAASPAATAIQLDTGHNRSDRRQVDMVVAVAAMLGLARRRFRNDRKSLPSRARSCPAPRPAGDGCLRARGAWRPWTCRFCRCPQDRPCRNRPSRAGYANSSKSCAACPPGLPVPRPSRKALDHLILRKQQIVLLGLGQHMKRGWCHGQFESSTRSPRKPFLPTP